MNTRNAAQKGVTVLSLILYLVACAGPLVLHTAVGVGVSGVQALLLGFMGVVVGHFEWYANIAYIISIVGLLVGARRLAASMSVLAILLSFQTVYLKDFPLP